ncbi:zinc finger protein 678 isoform X7 [Amyelois transitella]|uniref:zinc finger protein 678 isoform X7 n=1 Tax=Amyelois transitella TaxID=680683 RepID=UPI00299039AE|nr:zinc finger protein 678 isoform X7 [Amyelois transitella]
MDSRINNGICRCCASEGTFKDLATTYHWMGEEEIYAEMLKECFDIQLSAAEDSEQGGICEVCITQLRNASNFKKQVLHTEKQFKKRLQDKLFKSSIVKVEVPGPDDDALESDNDNNDDFSGTEYDVPIKEEEPADEPKPRKRAARATTSRAKKSKTERGETSTKRSRRIDAKLVKTSMKILNETENRSLMTKLKTDKKLANADELKKHYVNINEIMKNSNATPIKSRGGIGYTCCYCPEQFPDPADLKKHSINEHNDISKACFMQRKRLFEYNVRLDITRLKCKICNDSIENVEIFLKHLNEKHDIKVFLDIKSRILPFKFETESLQCFMCLNVFNKFKTLLEHMNSHYSNYFCAICNAGFVNLRQLALHKTLHITGSYFCAKTFDKLAKQQGHEKAVHKYRKMFKCGYCSERFSLLRIKEEHISSVHGIKTSPFKCQACEKEFVSLKRLYYHTKRDHLMERTHACSDCEKSFFSASQLKDHRLSHTGVKEYHCDVCNKSYGRKYTLTEHMRIHADDRRFKCEHCEQAFVQKCSWKSHMRAKHGALV